MSWELKKRIEAAVLTGRIPTPDELNEAEDRKRKHDAAQELKRLCDLSPFGVYFPGDSTIPRRDSWKPSFNISGRED